MGGDKFLCGWGVWRRIMMDSGNKSRNDNGEWDVLHHLTLPRVILGLDPGICSAAIEHRRSDTCGLSPFPNLFTGCPMQRIPGSSPRMTTGGRAMVIGSRAGRA